MSNTMDSAISNLLARAQTSASTATAEELVYLAKAIEAVAPGESANFLIQAAETEVATINTTGTTKTGEVNAEGILQVGNVNTAGGTQVAAVNAEGATQIANLLASGGSTGGLKSVQVFEGTNWLTGGNFTWTKPSGDIKKIRVQLVGAGGGSAGHNENGGAGGYAEKIIDVTNITSVPITIGTGGYTSNYGQSAGSGSTTSFGSYLSGTGGTGGVHPGHLGGPGGHGVGGDLNINGGGGDGHAGGTSSSGAASYFGGGAPGAHHSNGQQWEDRGAWGSGGRGEYTSHNNIGTEGHSGVVIVWEYGAG